MRAGGWTQGVNIVRRAALTSPLLSFPSAQVMGTSFNTRDGTCVRDYVHVTDLVDAHSARGLAGGIEMTSPRFVHLFGHPPPPADAPSSLSQWP